MLRQDGAARARAPGGGVALSIKPGEQLGGDAGALEAAHARHSLRLPDGGPIPAEAQRFFSPCFLWTRLPLSDEGNAAVRGPVFGAFEDYLRGYLAMVASSSGAAAATIAR